MKKVIIFTFGLFFVLLLSACSLLPQNEEAVLLNSTAVYRTVAAGLTETAKETDRPAVKTITALPSPSKTPVPSPATTTSLSPTAIRNITASQMPTKQVVLCNLAAAGRPYVDITIPDGTHFNPVEGFSKTWRLANAGSCNWTDDYAITWFSGEVFGAVTEQKLGLEVRPGQSIDITVDMTAPRQPGVHQSNWKLRDANGTLFGIGPNADAPFWVRIEVEVIAVATVTPEPTSTFTPTPASAAKGNIQLMVGTPVDLDTGKENTGSGDDFELQEKDGSSMMLALLNGTTMVEMLGQSPVLDDCLSATLKSQPVPAASLTEGSYFCYQTSQGLPGYFLIKNLALDDKKMSLDFLTWAIP